MRRRFPCPICDMRRHRFARTATEAFAFGALLMGPAVIGNWRTLRRRMCARHRRSLHTAACMIDIRVDRVLKECST